MVLLLFTAEFLSTTDILWVIWFRKITEKRTTESLLKLGWRILDFIVAP